MEIIKITDDCINEVAGKLEQIEVELSDIVAVGITNQRETAVAWNKVTGKTLHNALVWSDMRAESLIPKLLEELPEKDFSPFTKICGLPLAPTFTGLKYMWMLKNIDEVQQAASENRLCLGTIDTWVIYNLTRGINTVFVTDCTNASRTMLMNLDTLDWDPTLCSFFNIDSNWLPEIKSSSEIYRYIDNGLLKGVPISGCLGDQHAALLGHMCLKPGQIKNTYGTGCFLLCNTGTKRIKVEQGLIDTVAFKLGKDVPAMYAIEGSVAVAGSALNWLRDNMQILDDANSTKLSIKIKN